MLLALFPVRFTVLVAHVLVGMAVMYTIIAAFGIFDVDRTAFFIVYGLAALCILLSRYREVDFFFRKTRVDGPVAVALGPVFVIWALVAGIGGIGNGRRRGCSPPRSEALLTCLGARGALGGAAGPSALQTVLPCSSGLCLAPHLTHEARSPVAQIECLGHQTRE